jgi:hypothetical protein
LLDITEVDLMNYTKQASSITSYRREWLGRLVVVPWPVYRLHCLHLNHLPRGSTHMQAHTGMRAGLMPKHARVYSTIAPEKQMHRTIVHGVGGLRLFGWEEFLWDVRR